MRLRFDPVEPKVRLAVALSGLTVLAEIVDGPADEAWRLLCEAGASPEVDEVSGVSFPVRNLAAVAALPATVEVVCDEHLEPLVRFLRSGVSEPATLTLEAASLQLQWFASGHLQQADVTDRAALVLLTANVPFVASAQAWGTLASFGPVVGLAGQARMNVDGFVEIYAPVPQLVESAPLPGLFRLDATHFGLSAAFADVIDRVPGFAWAGSAPPVELPPAPLPDVALSRHAAEDLSPLVHRLAQSQAVVLWWEPSLGRRVTALAAVEALDAWPLLVVCPASAVWVWQRHLELMGRSSSLTHHRADARIVTYRDLALDAAFESPSTVIFDDLPGAPSDSLAAAVHRLDNLTGAYRIMTTSTFPADEQEACALMAALRPGEFTTAMPLAQRYPLTPAKRAREHVDAYVLRRTVSQTAPDEQFRRSSVQTLPATGAQLEAFELAASRHAGRDDASMLAEVLEIVSAGPSRALSPKLAVAAKMVSEARAAGRTIAVLCRHARAASLLKSMLRPMPVEVFEAAATRPAAPVSLVRFDRVLPDLRGFDEVVVLDYPWSSALLDGAVGSPSESSGPQQVTVLHLDCPVEDRLAMLAARRRELAALGGPQEVSSDEMRFVLAPLRTQPAAVEAPRAHPRPLLRQIR